MYQYFTERADTLEEAKQKVFSKYGPSAQIREHRTVTYGGFLGWFQKEAIEIAGYLKHDFTNPQQDRARLEEEKRKILQLAKEKNQAEEKKDDQLKAVLDEMKSLKSQLDKLPEKMQSPEVVIAKQEHPSLVRLQALLEDNEFSPPYVRMVMDRVRREFSLESLENFDLLEQSVVSWIAESIQVHEEKKTSRPRIFILVGPTGVGKTTTIAKLAAVYGLGFNGQDKLKLSMITIDNYRIGAKMQIESYGEIMGIPVTCVETFEALHQRIELDREVDMILVDTIGKSPKDFLRLAEMRQLLEACGQSSEVHLAVSATTKTKDIREIFQQFEPFGYQSVVVTKLDETSVVGNLLSLLWERGRPVSFITDGQSVPQDIQRASKVRLLKQLVGFSPDLIKKAAKE